MVFIDANELKARIAIDELIERSGYTVVRHNDNGPWQTAEHSSLTIYPDTNTFNWFSRNFGGDIFKWLEKVHGISFERALDHLSGNIQDFKPLTERPKIEVQQPDPLAQDLHLSYHRNLQMADRAWWHEQGINDEGISRFFLGVGSVRLPVGSVWQSFKTYTIPVIERGVLVDVRHRLAHPADHKDKYRPEGRGRGSHLFNRDILTPELGSVVVVAGEKKVIVLAQYGIPAISSTAGCKTWPAEWTTALQFCRSVYLCFDPGEEAHAAKIAEQIGDRAFTAKLTDKPDDLIINQGVAEFKRQVKLAVPFVDRDYWRKQIGGNRKLWGRQIVRD
jgi:DNA primase